MDDIRSRFTVREGGGNNLFFGVDPPVKFPLQDGPTVDRLARAWRGAIRDYPLAYLRHRLSFTAAFLGTSGPSPIGSANDPGSRPEDFDLRCPLPERYQPALFDRVHQWLLDVEATNVFRGWAFLVVLIGASLVAGLRRSLEARMLLLSGTSNLAIFAIAAVGPGFRYLWFTLVCALLSTCLAMARIPWAARRDGDTGPEPRSSDRRRRRIDPSLPTEQEHGGGGHP